MITQNSYTLHNKETFDTDTVIYNDKTHINLHYELEQHQF